jgi:sedoheptulose-bisphosphatase
MIGTANAFGDDQLNVDVLAERIIRAEITKCASIVTASSEEEPEEVTVRHDAEDADESPEKYTIAFDPLDGSSIIAPNWTVGTIIGIWDGSSALHQSPKAKQVASILGVYGPRTTAIVAWRIEGVAPVCFEVGLDDQKPSLCEIVRPQVSLLESPFKTRYFAPANLRAAAEDKVYSQLVTDYIQNKYTLRYSGGLVPDVIHTLVKGHGIYISPVTAVSKAKLRRLYELAPIALVMECAGGSSLDPSTGEETLAKSIEHCDERAGLVCGTPEEVSLVKKAFGF